MSVNNKQIPGTRLMFVAAVVMAAGAGFWYGEMRKESAGAENRRELRTRAHRERVVLDRDPLLDPVKLVREAVKGAVDDRQQWRQVRVLSEEGVRAANAELANAGGYFTRNSEFLEMLFYRWAQLNPVAANAAAKEMFPRNFSPQRRAVIAAWIKQGSSAEAWDAVQGDREMWDCTRSVKGEVADMLVTSFSVRDDAAAFREVSRLNDDNDLVADLLCRARAPKASATAETRAAFLAAASTHPSSYVLDCAYGNLFKEWAKADLDAAREGGSSLQIPKQYLETVRRQIDSAESARKLEEERAADGEP